MQRFLLPLLGAALLAACHPAPAQEAGPDGGPLPDGGHALPGPGHAAAWRVQDARELVTGPATGGRVGDWELANARVRYIIEDARPSDGYDPYGCSLAAADRQRPAGAPGESRFGEIWIGLNFRAAGCDYLSLVNDGSDGEPAVLRAVGHDAESPFMASLFEVTPADLHTTIYREYSLAPDSDALLLNLTLRNDGAQDLYLNKPYLGMAMNRGLRHWVDKSGFDFDSELARVNPSAEFYAAVGDKVSYSVINLDAPFSPIKDFAHVLIGQYPEVHIGPGQARTFRLALAVGTGDTGSLQAAHQQVQGALSPLQPVSGLVVDAQGAPVVGARVHVTNPAGDQSLAFARTADDGTWSSPMRIGSYGLRAVADDRPGSGLQPLSVSLGGRSGVRLQLGQSSRIEATATSSTGKPIPAKLVFEPGGAGREPLPGPLGEMWNHQPVVVFSADGHASVPVFPGTWHVTFSRGFEYDRPAFDVVAPAGSTAQASAVLNHIVDTTGWVSADFHVHAQFSPDGHDLLAEKVRAFAGEGVEVPVSTEHEFIGDFTPAVRALALDPFLHAMAGTELTTTYVGHFNIFPLTPRPEAPNNGGFLWYNRPVPEVLNEARGRKTPDGTAPIVQMNHPRALGMGYLSTVLFLPDSFQAQKNPEHWSPDWDAMEVWNGEDLTIFEGCPVPAVPPQVPCAPPSNPQAYDWFSFLDRGRRVTGTGNSDSHNASLREVGYPRTYVASPTDDPALVTDRDVSAALRGMRATISGGPFVTLSAPTGGSGSPMTGIGGLVAPDFTSGGTPVVHLTIDVRAAPWMGALSRVDIWQGDTSPRGAHIAQSLDLTKGFYADPGTKVQRLLATVALPVTADTWFLVTARGPVNSSGLSSALWPVVQTGSPPYAITNPIWVGFKNDGSWTPLRK